MMRLVGMWRERMDGGAREVLAAIGTVNEMVVAFQDEERCRRCWKPWSGRRAVFAGHADAEIQQLPQDVMSGDVPDLASIRARTAGADSSSRRRRGCRCIRPSGSCVFG
jgi:hypothetical protein